MRILFVLENFHPKVGGLEKLFKTLTSSLADAGHQVIVLTNGSGLDLPWKSKEGNVSIYRLPFFNRYLFTLLAVLPAWFLARRADLIHTTSYNAGLPAYFAAVLARRPSIITFHEVWGMLWPELPFFPKWSLLLHQKFEAFLLKLNFDRFVGPSNATVTSLEKAGVPPTKTARIYNGISYPSIEASSATQESITPFHFLFFGRLGISKGLDLLLPAAKILSDKNIPFELTLVVPTGPKKMMNWIRDTIADGNLNQVRIRHQLSTEELYHAISTCDCVVLPSYSEGFCFAAVETMAIGTPLIVSMGGALPEVIGGKHLMFPEQTAESLAAAMLSAVEEKWKEAPLPHYPLEDTIEGYLNLYSQILQESK